MTDAITLTILLAPTALVIWVQWRECNAVNMTENKGENDERIHGR